jgi:ribosomal protein S27E
MPAANGILVKCHHCGKEIYRPQWRLKRTNRQFCDAECYGKWLSTFTGPDTPAYKGTSVKVHCDHCGKIVDRDPCKIERNDHFFCCQNCYAGWRKINLCGENNPNFSTPAIETTCAWCGIAIQRKPWKIGTVKRKHHFCCAKHRAEWLKHTLVGPNSPSWKGGKYGYCGPNWRSQQRLARDRDNNTCQVCGKTQGQVGNALDVHHVKPFRSFNYIAEENENYRQANELSNLVTLCRSCHISVEFGKLTLKPK